MSSYDVDDRQNVNSMLIIEADKILADPVFQRSPVLSRLLKFLLEATLKGTADSLNSFAVAVDGLGRPDSFDAASDSSARVQMVRLRKALEGYYAHNGPSGDQCIYLQPASFRVRIGALPVAYPKLFGSRSIKDEDPDATPASVPNEAGHSTLLDAGRTDVPRIGHQFANRSASGVKFILIAFLAATALSITAYFAWQQFMPAKRTPMSPILELMPVQGASVPGLEPTARLISNRFADELPRFKFSRVRVIMNSDDVRQTANSEHIYRLYPSLEDNERGVRALFLRLNDVRTNTVIWSREVVLPDDPLLTAQAIVPLMSEINGPFGAVATQETAIYQDWNAGGYACVLKYFSFVATRAKSNEDKLLECIDKPVEEEEIVATMLAVRALFSLERSDIGDDFNAAAKTGMAFARAAVAADPNDGSANFAAARVAYALSDCASAKFYTKRTLETNSRSPLFTATLAALANTCTYPDADKLLDQALLVQNSTYAKGRLLLILAALSQNRPEKIDAIVASDLPETPHNRINYFLAESLIAVSQKNPKEAARNWELFAQAMLPESNKPEEKLRPIVMQPELRRQLIAILETGGAFGP